MSCDERVVSDFVVVGAGSAGSVVARRLIDAGYSVHVIEAGPADSDPAILSPLGWSVLLGGALDRGVQTTPQRHAAGRRVYWPRGVVLGGSSSVNGLIYVRGHPSDYDGWATVTGDNDWSWTSALPLFKRSEAFELGADEFHGGDGPLPVSRIKNPHPLSVAFVAGATALGHKPIADFNAGEMLGAGFVQTTTRNGERMSAWRSFVAPLLGHPRLTVTTGALVHRVVIDHGRAVAVEYTQEAGGSFRAEADSEIILSAGVLGSPKLLMLSGIGGTSHLESVGVTPLVELPGVGENLYDHPLLSNLYSAKEQLAPGENNGLEAQLFCRSSASIGVEPDLQPLFLHLPYPADGYPTPPYGYTIFLG